VLEAAHLRLRHLRLELLDLPFERRRCSSAFSTCSTTSVSKPASAPRRGAASLGLLETRQRASPVTASMRRTPAEMLPPR